LTDCITVLWASPAKVAACDAVLPAEAPISDIASTNLPSASNAPSRSPFTGEMVLIRVLVAPVCCSITVVGWAADFCPGFAVFLPFAFVAGEVAVDFGLNAESGAL
jgi:hypothetical protein